jgi:hypothetical protein
MEQFSHQTGIGSRRLEMILFGAVFLILYLRIWMNTQSEIETTACDFLTTDGFVKRPSLSDPGIPIYYFVTA